MTPERRQQTAYHEAGHAVAAEVMDLQVGTVTIEPKPQEGAAGTAEADEAGADWTTPNQRAVWAYAGHAAVVAMLGVGAMDYESADEHGAGQDYEDAAGEAGVDHEAAKAEALALVRRYRPVVERLAHLLEEHTTVGGQAVGVLMNCHEDGVEPEPFLALWGVRA